jgi:hypothetical protein
MLRAAPLTRSRVNVNLVLLAYLVIGAVVAAMHDYYAHVNTARSLGSAVLATLLWPLLFLGIDLHIH